MEHINTPPPPPLAILWQRAHAWLRRREPDSTLLRHVETLQLAPKRTLYLVECDGKRFLIAGGTDCLSAPVPLPMTVDDRT